MKTNPVKEKKKNQQKLGHSGQNKKQNQHLIKKQIKTIEHIHTNVTTTTTTTTTTDSTAWLAYYWIQ